MIRLVRRERASRKLAVAAPLLALSAAILSNLILFVAMGKDPAAVFYALLLEPFLTWSGFSEVLLKTGPLLLIAQGLAIGFRAKVFNIGAEGQFILGAIFASEPGLFSAGHGRLDLARDAGFRGLGRRALGGCAGVLAGAAERE